MQVIIHKSTAAILWRGTAYLVDGQPGIVVEPLALLDVTVDLPPVYDSEKQTVDWEHVPNYELETYHRTATVRALTEDEIEARKPSAEQLLQEEIALAQGETDEIYSSLPIEVQAEFAPVYVSAKDFISRGKFEVAEMLISMQQVPPELETAKAAILEKTKSKP